MTYVDVPVRLSRGLVSDLHTVIAWLLFHGLDISALLVLAGIALSLWRRMRTRARGRCSSSAMDFLPVILLFAISVTGLALTVSQEWLRGAAYSFLAILHAITVIAALLFLPFGKFFHIFQRPAQLGVKLYQEAGDADEGALCARCGERFASRMHIDDLRADSAAAGIRLHRCPGRRDTGRTLPAVQAQRRSRVAQLRIARRARRG